MMWNELKTFLTEHNKKGKLKLSTINFYHCHRTMSRENERIVFWVLSWTMIGIRQTEKHRCSWNISANQINFTTSLRVKTASSFYL